MTQVMYKTIFPKVFQQFIQFASVLWLIFFSLLYFYHDADGREKFNLVMFLLILAASFLMSCHFYWILLAAGNHNPLRDCFLVTLPLSRKRIARDGIHFFIQFYLCVAGIIFSVGTLLYLLGLVNGAQLILAVFTYACFVTISLLLYLICKEVRSALARIIFASISFPIFVAQAISLLGKQQLNNDVLFFLILIIIASLALSVLIHRYQEKKFINKELK